MASFLALPERSREAISPSVIDSQIPGGYISGGEDTSPTVSTQLSLASRVNERRGDFTRPSSVRIRVGSWNVASHKGTELDLAGWFVGGKGVSDSLTGSSHPQDGSDSMEDANQQEARWSKYHTTIPKGDTGAVPAGGEIGLYVLGLQEIVDISSPAEALRPFADTAPASKYKEAVERALPPGYQLIAERQLIGLLLLIWASPAVLPQVSAVSTTSVGTGLMGYMGNKGAVTARIMLGGTTRLVFINSHLSAGTGKSETERRNWDVSQIISRTRFDPIIDDSGVSHAGERIGDEDFAFWFGDLNYRMEGIPPDDVRRLLMLHTRNEYDLGSKSEAKIENEIGISTSHMRAASSGSHGSASSSAPGAKNATSSGSKDDGDYHPDDSENPASLQTTIDSLLPHDELLQHMKGRRMFHDGWREGPITFLPTYKYDRGTVGVFDTTEKKRGPSWCDRILYRTRNSRLAYAESVQAENESKQRDAEIKAQGLESAVREEESLFEYDPDEDYDDEGEDDGSVERVKTKEGFEDKIKLEYYITHQRVLSSDHKPIDAGFMLMYDAIAPELKAKVHQEVARELDKAENEGRPVVTMVVDGGPIAKDPQFDGADFGKLRYDEPKFRTVTIANTGRISAEFGFAIRPQEPPLTAPQWLSIRFDRQPRTITKEQLSDPDAKEWYDSVPRVFTLRPGESCTVDLIAEVANKDLLRSLNHGEHIEDVLVLRVKNGRDQFLALRAKWRRSSHGHTLDKLLRFPEGGVRKLQNQHPEGKWKHRFHHGSHSRGEQNSSDDHTAHSYSGSERSIGTGSTIASGRNSEETEVRWSAPREILRLTQAIEAMIERCLAEYSMLGSLGSAATSMQDLEISGTTAAADATPPWALYPGWPFVAEAWTFDADSRRTYRVQINEALDTDEPFEKHLDQSLPLPQRLEVFAETLLLFLTNMQGGIITSEAWRHLEQDFFHSTKRASIGPRLDDQKAAVLEVLSLQPKHSTTFMLLMSSLARMTAEIGTALKENGYQETQQQAPGILGRPGRLLRKLTADGPMGVGLGRVSKARVQRRFVDIFAPMVVHTEQSTRVNEDDRRELLEMFLRSE